MGTHAYNADHVLGKLSDMVGCVAEQGQLSNYPDILIYKYWFSIDLLAIFQADRDRILQELQLIFFMQGEERCGK
ncbi:hypothetical protein GCM10027278_15440 [Paralcaligenes ginsengisoli]